MTESPKLRDKRCIITGAASGIGRATARLFLEHGARILAVDLQAGALEKTFPDNATTATLVQDVAVPEAPANIVSAALDAMGGIDILVNNAGICLPGAAENLDDDTWDRTMSVNVRSMFRITREAIPHLKECGRGRIINVGSIMSDMAGPGLCAYGASKHAVAGLTKAMAVDLGQYCITANYLQPGSIITALSEPFMKDPGFKAYWEAKAPIGRLGNAEEVAAAALYLASNEAQFVSGVGLNVDGGAIVKF